MTVAAHRAPNGDERLRIAITSPDILAQIRQVFAGKNLVVDIVGMPYVEVAVRPAPNTRAHTHADSSAADNAVRALAGPDPAVTATPGTKSLRAEYRLSVIRAEEDSPRAERGTPPARPRRRVAGVAGRTRRTGTGRGAGTGSREITLSQRQREVMTLMSRGARNAEIAESLHVTEKTVKNHINRIFRELGTDSRVEAVLLWQRLQAEDGGGR
ncbi:helix-turn-helix transcriptional regulator [Catenulispora pinisilvae]|uniref:helix-turn-helix transcriptional regulator n=1 Tax=Catenulispora pinisilvae TaxID=2705253 RepID=UPI0018920DA3|nr:helix-turn-helix transcriptional regulator [Catenulispora pinisilvae]